MFGLDDSDFSQDGDAPVKMSLYFHPIRLSALKKNYVDLVITLRNTSNERKLLSIDVNLPRNCQIGLDETAITKSTEERVGWINPGEVKELAIRMWANVNTKQDVVPVKVTAYLHYLNYNKVLSKLEKSVSLRIV